MLFGVVVGCCNFYRGVVVRFVVYNLLCCVVVKLVVNIHGGCHGAGQPASTAYIKISKHPRLAAVAVVLISQSQWASSRSQTNKSNWLP